MRCCVFTFLLLNLREQVSWLPKRLVKSGRLVPLHLVQCDSKSKKFQLSSSVFQGFSSTTDASLEISICKIMQTVIWRIVVSYWAASILFQLEPNKLFLWQRKSQHLVESAKAVMCNFECIYLKLRTSTVNTENFPCCHFFVWVVIQKE